MQDPNSMFKKSMKVIKRARMITIKAQIFNSAITSDMPSEDDASKVYFYKSMFRKIITKYSKLKLMFIQF
jgi:hypothetical protein